MQYVRAFFKALQLTLRGEAITTPPTRYPNLQAWLDTAQQKLAEVEAQAAKLELDETAQKQIILELDGRPWSMALILSSIKFHLEMEYPSLMQSVIEHNLTTLYALHFDDKYRIDQLAQTSQVPEELRPILREFAVHFINIPPSTDP